jgi:hypothetical protein
MWAGVAVQAGLPDGLVAYYRFNESSGLTAVDETGAHNGTLTGALTWVPGVEGNALQFRGGNGSPFVNTGAWQTNGPDGLSLAVWVKWAGSNSLYQGLLAQRQGTMYWWVELSTDAAQLRFKSNTSPQSNLFQTTPHLIQDEWVHVAFSHDAAAGRGFVFLNGEEELAGAWTLPSGTFSNLNVGIGVVNTADGLGTFNGALDEAMIFNVPLTADGVKGTMRGFADPIATDPSPATGQSDVPVDAILSWTGNGAAPMHDVYLGTSADDVAAAERTDPRDVLASEGQTDTTYTAGAPLEYGRTYAWRVDEVNGAPDNTITRGETWTFTTEPYAYPISGVTATASSFTPGMGPEKAVDGSGLTGDVHSSEGTEMWLSNPTGPQPTWIQFEFEQVCKLSEMWVWNSNQIIEAFVGFGAKDVTVEYSPDGHAWVALEGVPEFAQGTGMAGYGHNTTVDFGGVEAKYVRLTIDSNWGTLKQYGLSEVRFFYIPVQARLPEPAPGATGVSVDAVLNWRPGREATSHEVYLGTDENALTLADTVAGHGYTPASLDFGTTYFWKVDEVGETAAYPGEVWSFTTQEYATIEDFESYNDDDSRIYDAWIDGLTDAAKGGSQVGYDVSPFAEKTIVHGGGQSLPLQYDNTASPFLSEAERTFDSPQNWSTNGADSLVVYFRGVAPAFAQTASGSIFMNAIGADIWGNADQFRYVYKTLNGNGSMVARVESVYNSNAWAKAGVMIRQSIDPASTHAFMPITPGGSSAGNGASFQRRLATSGASSNNDSTMLVAAPYWVKIERVGDAFSGYISPDGVAWTQLGAAQTIAMTNPVLIGLALTSHDAVVATSAEFSNVSITGNATGNWQVAEIGVEQPAGNSMEGLYLSIKDSSGKAKIVQNPDAAATARTGWQQWEIPLSEFTSAGVKMNAVKSVTLGVGVKAAPQAGGTGIIYIDDLGYGRSAQ